MLPDLPEVGEDEDGELVGFGVPAELPPEAVVADPFLLSATPTPMATPATTNKSTPAIITTDFLLFFGTARDGFERPRGSWTLELSRWLDCKKQKD
jgi:hypothetical protein